MGEQTRSGGGGRKRFYKINGQKGCIERKDKDGNIIELDSIEGELTNIVRKVNIPKENQKWKAHVSYELTLTDHTDVVDEQPMQMKLTLIESFRTTEKILNCLRSVEVAGTILIGAFSKVEDGKDKLIVYVKNNGESVKFHYNEWDDANKTYKGIPPRKFVQTGINSVTKKPEGTWNTEAVDAFWREEVKQIYLNFTGQQWDSAKNEYNPSTINQASANASVTEQNNAKKLIDNIQKCASIEAFLKTWDSVAKYIKTMIKDDMLQSSTLSKIEQALQSKFNKTYELSLDNAPVEVKETTVAPQQEESLPFGGDDDDLPF